MSIWIELHCDVASQELEDWRPGCKTAAAEVDGVLIKNNAAAMNAALRSLKRSHLENGWKHTKKDGWVCPFCQRHKEMRD